MNPVTAQSVMEFTVLYKEKAHYPNNEVRSLVPIPRQIQADDPILLPDPY
jgi:hypothetical protein